ncbi:MAG: PTS sugar transporter subunit IIA [Chloroflexi bacterium]|nr:PTS sugar transporter subunit IIA [Chloroflexota bacterium]
MTSTPVIAALLTLDTVAAGVSTAGWEEAVETVGKLLEQAGFTTDNYIPAMKRTIKELGPYAVIAPGIAMPHARPEDGVLLTGFALITLDPAVDFGSQVNDPVDIVLAFGATDKQTHIKALQEIAAIFGNQEKISAIRAAQTSQELLVALHGLNQ